MTFLVTFKGVIVDLRVKMLMEHDAKMLNFLKHPPILCFGLLPRRWDAAVYTIVFHDESGGSCADLRRRTPAGRGAGLL